MKVQANGISIEVEDTPAAGSERGIVVLLMGLGMQLVAWPPSLVHALTEAGYRVVRMDNRDAGLSKEFDELGVPNLAWEGLKQRIGLPVKPPYTLADMAADTLGVMDALGIAKAHLVGVSMGGMIAQRVALAAPGRVQSLTSIMSSSGDRRLPGPRPEVLRALLRRPEGKGEDAIVDHTVKLFHAIGSPGFPSDEKILRDRIRFSTRRAYRPKGVLRQMVAVISDTRRAAELAHIKVPTLVMHGKDDPLVPLACGQDTARRIKGACFVAVPGMGHDLPAAVVDILLQPLLSHLKGNTPALP